MAAARSSSTRAPAARRRGSATRRPPTGIRWDRLGRLAMLGVLGLVLYLYIGPTRTWITTYGEAADRRAEVAELKRDNARLKARRAELRSPSAMEREARRLGMVRGGEKAYVVEGLPGRD